MGEAAGSGGVTGAVLTTIGALAIAMASAPAAAEPLSTGAWPGLDPGVREYVLETTGMRRWVTTRRPETTRRLVVPRETVRLPTTLPVREFAAAAAGVAVPVAGRAGSATCGNRGTGIENAGIETTAAGASICALMAPTISVAYGSESAIVPSTANQ
jgi:hypothetical protein